LDWVLEFAHELEYNLLDICLIVCRRRLTSRKNLTHTVKVVMIHFIVSNHVQDPDATLTVLTVLRMLLAAVEGLIAIGQVGRHVGHRIVQLLVASNPIDGRL
jgi:hypothetical protein